ncbi:MAG: hypothetical protein ABI946_11055 [Chthoniobacterales bacterium]
MSIRFPIMLARSRPGLANNAAIVSGLFAAGFALRFFHYARDPALWHDEAANVLNILGKSFSELLGPLYVSSTGPPVFLWLQKCAFLLLGDSLYALRLVSLLASCAGLIVFLRAARMTLAPVGLLSAGVLVACSDRLLWHAAEARHYSSDFFVGAILLLALGLTTSWTSARRAFLFALLAPLVIFSSYPGVFLCGGVFLALWPTLRRDRAWAAAGLFAFSVALSFAVFYFFTIRAQRSPAMDSAWVHAFPDWQRPWTLPLWAARSTMSVFDFIGRPLGGLLLIPAVVGGVWWWRRGQHELLSFAVVPMLLALTAALAKAYPYTGARTMVFAMPALALLVGSGVDEIVRWRPRAVAFRVLALVLITIPLVATVGLAGYRTVVPWPRAATDLASTYVLSHRQADEPVTANHWEYEYYFRFLGAQFSPELGGLAQVPRAPRVWVVVSGHPRATRDEVIASELQNWRIVERREFERTSVLLVTPR